MENRESSSSPLTRSEWYEWLKHEEALRCEEYCLRGGDRLISDFRHESDVKRDYEGREILELLQNAGDAASEMGEKGKVRLHLLKEGLVIANTGTPFGTDGVKSLQTANLSPKKKGKGLRVGEKGLGFRSILNWCRTPIIDSGNLRIIFSEEYSEQIVEKLKRASDDLALKVEEEQVGVTGGVVSKLAFPAYSEDADLSTWLNDHKYHVISKLCVSLREEGFDTSIGMPFQNEECFREALKQIQEIPPELLLFVETIAELQVRIDDEGEGPIDTWRREVIEGDKWKITKNSKSIGEWIVYKSAAESVPVEDRDEAKDGDQFFEMTVAVPQHQVSRPVSPLYAYFPTEVDIPLPLVCHATLRLEENRKRPTLGKANRYILRSLARRIVGIAADIVAKGVGDPWAGIGLVSNTGIYPKELSAVEFEQVIHDEIKNMALIPCLDGQFRCSSDVVYVPGASSTWLPVEGFGDVVMAIEDQYVKKFIKSLEVTELTKPELIARCQELELDVESRARLISGIVRNDLHSSLAWSGLLVDQNGNPILEGNRAFLSGEVSELDIPKWAPFAFLDGGLRRRIEELLEERSSRNLQRMLKEFEVEEFSVSTMIQRLIAAGNRTIASAPTSEGQIRHEMLSWLYALYVSKGKEGVALFPRDSGFKMLTVAGSYRKPDELYLCESYGLRGAILQGVYGGWADDKLVGDPYFVEPGYDEDVLVSFMQWLGVADLPREVKLWPVDKFFTDHVLSRLSYPVVFEEYSYSSSGDVEGFRISNALSIDELDKVIENAPPAAVLGWLAVDGRFDGWLTPGSKYCSLTSRKAGDRKPRYSTQKTPCYITWRLGSSAWLPSSGEGKSSPYDVILPTKAIEALFPRPVDFPYMEKDRYGLADYDVLHRAWTRAGVKPGLDNLSLDEVYELLNILPKKSADGKAAKAVYRWFLESSERIYGNPGPEYDKFMKSGRMWGSARGEQGYYPVLELMHVDTDLVPRELLHHFSLVDLPTRIGGQKVERLFGVKNLTKSEVGQSVDYFQAAPCAVEEARYFNESKPALSLLRQSQVTKADKLKALDDLELVLCDQLRLKLTISGKEIPQVMKPWVGVVDSGTLYIGIDPSEGCQPSRELLAEAIGSEIARLFELTNGDAFARIYQCPPARRQQLLRRMCGGELAESAPADGGDFREFPIYKGRPTEGEEDTIEVEETEAEGKSEVDSSLPTDKPKLPIEYPKEGGIEVEEVEHTPKVKRPPMSLVVTRVPSSDTTKGLSHDKISGEKCEELAESFERDQGRFPLRVGNVKGLEGAGCDLFSFQTEGDRDAFISGSKEGEEVRDMSLVSRFIEVKGRSLSGVTIGLEGNELACARKRKARYYLYRISPLTEGGFELKELQDPMSEREALAYKAVIDPDVAEMAKVYRIRSKVPVDEQGVDKS